MFGGIFDGRIFKTSTKFGSPNGPRDLKRWKQKWMRKCAQCGRTRHDHWAQNHEFKMK